MKRVIRFRILDEEGSMIHSDLEEISRSECSYWLSKNYRKENTPIMQCTGLQDKNGKDIYEGDVLLVSYQSDFREGCNKVLSVIYDNERARFRFKDWLEPIEDYHVEVIGNIYENPELI